MSAARHGWPAAVRAAAVGAGIGLAISVLLDLALAAGLHRSPIPDLQLTLTESAMVAIGASVALLGPRFRNRSRDLDADPATFRLLHRVVLGGRADPVPEHAAATVHRFALRQAEALPVQMLQQLLLLLAFSLLEVSGLLAAHPTDLALRVGLLAAVVVLAVVTVVLYARYIRNVHAYLAAHPPPDEVSNPAR